MTRAFPRTSLHSSKLVRCLADLAILDAIDPGNAFAEKLGLWIHFTDAITLSAVHGNGSAAPQKPRLPIRHKDIAAHAAVDARFKRTRAGLLQAIVRSCSPGPGNTHIRLPAPPLELPLDPAAAYKPYRRFYEAHQRDMELSIQPLRINAREAVAKASPPLRKLAELDAMFEKILRERESKLLSRVPILLGKRFTQLFNEHQQKLADAGQTDNPAGWTRPGAWLTRFCNDMQMLLLAEADFRLQPAMGLMEAFKQDT